ncbi:unnamed protein product [marine sediment metagenome]|uniref:Uncharacterized protein n=1 Tax=marine sediment metagenome TaxID=412755 RepID=X0YNG3_9ZZZZ
MLIARILVNNRSIEDILIHNKGKALFPGHYEYEVFSAEGYNEGERKVILDHVYHCREDGHRKLLSNILRMLDEKQVEEKIL